MAKGRIPGDQFEEAFVGTQSVRDGLTAAAGGGQPNGTLIITQLSRFTTVASANDSAKLPALASVPPGTEITVSNAAAANSMNVFPATGDAIDALGANNARAVAAGKTCVFISYGGSGSVWHSQIGA